jgi:hypothetical protein
MKLMRLKPGAFLWFLPECRHLTRRCSGRAPRAAERHSVIFTVKLNMAIFGIGAHYGVDVSGDFLEQGCACVGWKEEEAPPAHGILGHLRTGDVIFIKSFAPHVGLTIKAVGIVLEGKVQEYPGLRMGVPVRWLWIGEDRIGKLDDKWPVRSVTIFEEHHPKVQARVLELLLSQWEGESS